MNFTILTAIFLVGLPLALAAPQCGIGGDGNAYYTSTTEKSVSECIYTCEIDTKCRSSEFKPSNGKCWLYDKPVVQAKTQDDNTGKYIFNDKGCPWVQCGLPADGSDSYETKKVKSTEECQSACRADKACLSSEFRYDNGNCWLNSKRVSEAKNKETGGEYVFYDRDCPALQCWVPGDGSNFYTVKKVTSAQDCQRACKNDTICLSSEYKKITGDCWLYDKPVAEAKTRDTAATWIFFDKDCSVAT
jgi:hypothetical protein